MFGVVEHVRVCGTGHSLPNSVWTNKDLGLSDSADLWVKQNIGVHERRFVAPGETSVDLAIAASKHAMTRANIDAGDVGLLLVATSSPVTRAPSTACHVQAALGVTNGSPAFDLQAVCSGFVYALAAAASMMSATNARYALVVGVDTFSTATDRISRDRVFFGDGAGAVVLEFNETLPNRLSFLIAAEGQANPAFEIPAGETFFRMDSRAVLDHATLVLPETLKTLLRKRGLTPSDIEAIVPHQPSKRVLDAFATAVDVSPDLVLRSVRETGNTAAASIPILLSLSGVLERVQPPQVVALAAVGSGWTWGACLLE